MILPKSFYNRPTIEVARDLLGCFLVRKIGSEIVKMKIVEVEAYDGPGDLASHASHGKTLRNSVMFGQAGIIYVYLIYGMHYMFNIVTGEKNYPAAVLIRTVKPAVCPAGKIFNTNGPAKLTKALKISITFNGLPVYVKKYDLWVEGRGEKIKAEEIISAKRIGVDYAKEYKDKLWRFYLRDTKKVSDTFFGMKNGGL